MQNTRTHDLSKRLNTAWVEWQVIELSDDVNAFIADIEATSNNRMVKSSLDQDQPEQPYFMLRGEGEIYHFFLGTRTGIWYCKA